MSQQSAYLNTRDNRTGKPKRKTVSRCWTCQWCGKVLQVTLHKFERKDKDFCNVYCHRPYYDFMKRLSQKLESSSLALFTEELSEKRDEILNELIMRVPAKGLHEIFLGYTRIVRSKITKHPLIKKKLLAKRFLILNLKLNGYEESYDGQFQDDFNILNLFTKTD
jgi:hypothetical protein